MDELVKSRLNEIAEREGLSRNTVKLVYHWFRRKVYGCYKDEEPIEDHVNHFLVRKGVPKKIREVEGVVGDGSKSIRIITEIAGVAMMEREQCASR